MLSPVPYDRELEVVMSKKLTHVLFVGRDKELLEFRDLDHYIRAHCKALDPNWTYIGKYLSNIRDALEYVESQAYMTTVVINHLSGHTQEQMKQFAIELSHVLRRQNPTPSVYLIDTGVGVAYLQPIFQKYRIPVALNTENILIDIIVDFDAVFGKPKDGDRYVAKEVEEEMHRSENGKLQEQLAFMDF